MRFCCVYFPYETGLNGKEMVAPQRLGGMETEASLPYKSIKNPLYSVSMCNYWKAFGWNAQIAGVVETALDVEREHGLRNVLSLPLRKAWLRLVKDFEAFKRNLDTLEHFQTL